MKIFKIAQEKLYTDAEVKMLKNSPYQDQRELDPNEYKLDWLKRHEYLYLKNGEWTFYHGIPRDTFKKTSYLSKDSLITSSIEKAVHFASRDRDLNEDDIVVLELKLKPNEFSTGIFPSIEEDINFNDNRVKIVKL
jgi:hypothetical protein